MNTNHSRLILATAITALIIPSIALGQGESRVLEEVLVTAQKRMQSLQDVPISATVLSGERLESASIVDLEDLSEYVPSMHISRAATSTVIRMRGIGSTVNKGFEQSVGMYVDGVYLGRGRQFRMGFLDLERVEVLRGPQGTLFGKNTIAGAINIASRSPVVNEEANGNISIREEWDDETTELVGGFSVPLGDKAAFRLAGKYRESDGYLESRQEGKPTNQPEEWNLRGTLVWDVTEDLNLNLKLGRSEAESTGTVFGVSQFKYIAGPGPGLFAFNLASQIQPDLLTLPNDHDVYNDPFNWSVANGEIKKGPPSDDTQDFFALTANWDINENWSMTSISSYTAYDFEEYLDPDFTPVRFLARGFNDDFEQYSQELRFEYSDGDGISAIGGLYYEKQEVASQSYIGVDGSFGGQFGQVAPVDNLFKLFLGPSFALLPVTEIYTTGDFEQDAETYAVFAEVSFDLSESLMVTVGARYSEEKKDAKQLNLFYSDVTGGSTVPSEDSLLFALWQGLFGFHKGEISGDRKKAEFDPSVKLQWDVADNTMFYATYSNGSKGGGFSASETTVVNPDGSAPSFEFNDESADAYEIGLKTEFLDGAARVNAALFYTEYEDLQVSTWDGSTFTVTNAAGADIQGLEIESQWRATNNFTVSASLAYLDFEFVNFDNAGCTQQQTVDWVIPADGAPCTQSLTGKANSYAPEYSGNLNANYFYPINSNLNVVLDFDINFTDDFYTSSDLDEENRQDSFEKYNARIALEHVDGKWWIAAYGTNLTDEVTNLTSLNIPLITGSKASLASDGRVYGVNLGYRF